jgi:hypothetical protein
LKLTIISHASLSTIHPWLGSKDKGFQGQVGRRMYSVATMNTVGARRKIGKGNIISYLLSFVTVFKHQAC